MDPYLAALDERVLVFDGAMGTELMLAGLEQGGCGEAWNLTHPDRVLAIQKRYADAEPLLVAYLETIRGARGVPKPAVQAAGNQVIKLYEAWGKQEKAAEWREKLK